MRTRRQCGVIFADGSDPRRCVERLVESFSGSASDRIARGIVPFALENDYRGPSQGHAGTAGMRNSTRYAPVSRHRVTRVCLAALFDAYLGGIDLDQVGLRERPAPAVRSLLAMESLRLWQNMLIQIKAGDRLRVSVLQTVMQRQDRRSTALKRPRRGFVLSEETLNCESMAARPAAVGRISRRRLRRARSGGRGSS